MYGIEDGPEQNLIPVLKDSGDSRSPRTSCPWESAVRNRRRQDFGFDFCVGTGVLSFFSKMDRVYAHRKSSLWQADCLTVRKGDFEMAFKKTRNMKVYGMSGENDIIGLSRKTVG